jgi:hypothetical protein
MNFITNFRPINTNIDSNFFFKVKTKNRIMSRNFILFLLLINYLKNNVFFLNFSFFVKPFFKKSSVILRAPYKNKLSRHQLAYNRYNLMLKFNFRLNEFIKINHLSDLMFLIKKIKSFFLWFESNICYQHKIKFNFNLNYINNFLLKKY